MPFTEQMSSIQDPDIGADFEDEYEGVGEEYEEDVAGSAEDPLCGDAPAAEEDGSG